MTGRLNMEEKEQDTSLNTPSPNGTVYDASTIKTLSSLEHIRHRPGMYIGRMGDGSHPDDGVYVMIKEIIDNSIDEYIMGYGRRIDIAIEGSVIRVRDYGRGIPERNTTAMFSSSPSDSTESEQKRSTLSRNASRQWPSARENSKRPSSKKASFRKRAKAPQRNGTEP